MLGKIGDLSFITHAAFQCTLINKGTQSFVFQKCDEMPEGKPQIYIQRRAQTPWQEFSILKRKSL